MPIAYPCTTSIVYDADLRNHTQISKEEFLNPIKQDTKKGKLRFVRNCFPHKGYLWNYGAFPRVSGKQPIAPAATTPQLRPAINKNSPIDSIN